MNHNRVCNLSDFEDPTLRQTLLDIYGDAQGYDAKVHRKSAEIAHAVMTLRAGGALREGARILGVGAGKEPTIFYLTRFAEVHATDIYLDAGVWSEHAPRQMLIDPMAVELDIFGRKVFPADLGCVPQRLIVQHMDARELRYPDDHFDGVFTSSSIEHFGTREDVAAAAREMGRVLKPGGVAAISTEWMIAGSPYMGFDGVLLFDEDAIERYIVEPSGLKMVDALMTDVDDASLATEVSLTSAIKRTTYPHIVVRHEGYLFTSVHLTLRKPGRTPEWEFTRGSVRPAITSPIKADGVGEDKPIASRKRTKQSD